MISITKATSGNPKSFRFGLNLPLQNPKGFQVWFQPPLSETRKDFGCGLNKIRKGFGFGPSRPFCVSYAAALLFYHVGIALILLACVLLCVQYYDLTFHPLYRFENYVFYFEGVAKVVIVAIAVTVAVTVVDTAVMDVLLVIVDVLVLVNQANCHTYPFHILILVHIPAGNDEPIPVDQSCHVTICGLRVAWRNVCLAVADEIVRRRIVKSAISSVDENLPRVSMATYHVKQSTRRLRRAARRDLYSDAAGDVVRPKVFEKGQGFIALFVDKDPSAGGLHVVFRNRL